MFEENDEMEHFNVPFVQTLRPGLVLQGRYMLKKKLGAGGFAVVYLAHDAQIDRDVAIKVLNIHGIEDNPQKRQEFTARFEREAKLAARVRHSAVMEVYEYGMANQGTAPFIAMEYLQGHDLEEQLERFGPLEPEHWLKLFIPCLEALGFAHNEGIVHKDLKPSNLFIKYPGERRESMTLVDFGVAHIQAQYSKRLTQTGNLFATPSYIAPEYAQDQIVCPPLDIYQMGLILIEGLIGQPVVDVDDFMLAILTHAQGNLEIPSYLMESSLGKLLKKSLALDHTQRYQNGFEFADALRQIDPKSVPTKPDVLTFVKLNELSADQVNLIDYQEVSNDETSATPPAPKDTLTTGEFPGLMSPTPPGLNANQQTMVLEPKPREAKKKNWPAIILVVLLLFTLITLGLVQLQKKTIPKSNNIQLATKTNPAPEPKEDPTKDKRGLILNSTPTGAAIYQGRKMLGVTPLRYALPKSTEPALLTVKSPGFISQQINIPLDEDTEFTTNIAMVKKVDPENSAPADEKTASKTVKKRPTKLKVKPALVENKKDPSTIQEKTKSDVVEKKQPPIALKKVETKQPLDKSTKVEPKKKTKPSILLVHD